MLYSDLNIEKLSLEREREKEVHKPLIIVDAQKMKEVIDNRKALNDKKSEEYELLNKSKSDFDVLVISQYPDEVNYWNHPVIKDLKSNGCLEPNTLLIFNQEKGIYEKHDKIINDIVDDIDLQAKHFSKLCQALGVKKIQIKMNQRYEYDRLNEITVEAEASIGLLEKIQKASKIYGGQIQGSAQTQIDEEQYFESTTNYQGGEPDKERAEVILEKYFKNNSSVQSFYDEAIYPGNKMKDKQVSLRTESRVLNELKLTAELDLQLIKKIVDANAKLSFASKVQSVSSFSIDYKVDF